MLKDFLTIHTAYFYYCIVLDREHNNLHNDLRSVTRDIKARKLFLYSV